MRTAIDSNPRASIRRDSWDDDRPPRSEPARIRYTPFGQERVAVHGYHSAREQRQSGRPMPEGGSADFHNDWDLDDLRAMSAQFDRDNSLYNGLLNRSVDCILGTGFVLQSKARTPERKRRVETLWNSWWEDPEVRGLHDGQGCTEILLRSIQMFGDNGIILDDETEKIQLIESEQIYTTKLVTESGNIIVDGIELDRLGKMLAGWVSDYDSFGRIKPGGTRIPAERFLLPAHRTRISQTRGVPCMQSAFPMLHRINDVCDSEALAWQILSRFAVAIEQELAPEDAAKFGYEDKNYTTQALAKRVHDLGSGLFFHGRPRESLKGIDRNIPGANFERSLTMFLRLLGIPLGLPLELVLLDWSKTSWSSARAAIKQAERMFHRWQSLLKRRFLKPIFEWKLNHWIQRGLVPNAEDVYWYEFSAPPYPFVDPQKEMEARKLRYETGSTSSSLEAKQDNRDHEDLLRMQEQDIDAICAMIERINTKYPFAKLTLGDVSGFGKTTSKAPAPQPAQAGPDNTPNGTTPPTPPDEEELDDAA